MADKTRNQTIAAGGCLVLVPGVLSGLDSLPAASPALSVRFCRLLGFADQIALADTDLPSVESLVSDLLLPAEKASCAARLTHLKDYPANAYDHRLENTAVVMRADPAYQQIDMNNATLGNPLELELTLDECSLLQQTLNDHFVDDGIRFECKDPHRWYCHFESPLQVTTTTLSAAIGRDVASVRPDGAQARQWRSKLAEIEMLLFEHPINTERQENNKLPVNTLWLWGEGNPAAVSNVEKISIYTDNFYAQSVSDYLGVECSELPAVSTEIKASRNPALIVIDKFTHPVSAQISQEEKLRWFDEVVCDQLWNGLQSSGWSEVTLWCGDNRLFRVKASVKKQLLRRLFHKAKPLTAFLPDTGLQFDEPMQTSPQAVGQQD